MNVKKTKSSKKIVLKITMSMTMVVVGNQSAVSNPTTMLRRLSTRRANKMFLVVGNIRPQLR